MTRLFKVYGGDPEAPKKDPRPNRYQLTFLSQDRPLLDQLRAIGEKEKRSLRNLIIVALGEWIKGRKS